MTRLPTPLTLHIQPIALSRPLGILTGPRHLQQLQPTIRRQGVQLILRRHRHPRHNVLLFRLLRAIGLRLTWAAMLTCADHATDAADLRELLAMLALANPAPGSRRPGGTTANRCRPRTVCAACGQLCPLFGNGWCEPCNQRWRNAGRPHEGPPPAGHRAQARRAAYAQLRAGGLSRDQAAAELGITVATARTYDKTPTTAVVSS